MKSHEKRLQRLEAVLPRWPANVEAAKQRTLAGSVANFHLRPFEV
jgi:hypothetical protein